MESQPSPSRLESWRRLADGGLSDLVEAAAVVVAQGVTPAGVSGLKKRFPRTPVFEALELAESRSRAVHKFPRPDLMLMDRSGLEQATAAEVSHWKAGRFGALPVLDLCSGIGGDAMGFARRGPCVAVDRDPVRALMTAQNAEVETRVAAVEDCPIDLPLVHLDPARRDEAAGRRSWRIEDLQPGIETIRSVVDAADGGAVKLGPGFPTRQIELHPDQSVSVVAYRGRLVQAVVWTGTLANPEPAEAVDLPSGHVYRGTPSDLVVQARDIEPGQVLVEFHPAIERLGLSGTLLEAHGEVVDWREPAPGLGLVTGPPPSGGVPSPLRRWCRMHRVRAVCGARIEDVQARIRDLPEADARRVVVRTRAKAVDADGWTRILNPGSVSNERAPIEVFGLRIGNRKVSIVCLGDDEGPIYESAS